MSADWLSLSAVAKELGVHPNTVRNWADQGRIPVHRTPGGHRRFRYQEVILWKQAKHASTPDDADRLVKDTLHRTRFHIAEGNLENEDWYQKLDHDARMQYRLSGRTLLQGLSTYLASSAESAGGEARALGYEYAVRGRRHGLSVMDATQAFLFFRNTLLEAMFEGYDAAHINSPYVWSDMFRKITAFTDDVMITLLETYTAFERNNK
ncbi:MAG: helix-turn-helix domain-containing protein [Chloroflexota bacterium]